MSSYICKGGMLIALPKLRMTFQRPNLLEEDKVANFVGRMNKGEEFPPVEVRCVDGDAYELLDGYHRQQASHRCGFTHIPCEVVGVPVEIGLKAKK